jgi:hypothetical protein
MPKHMHRSKSVWVVGLIALPLLLLSLIAVPNGAAASA